jgi:hypothetical protein
VAVGRGRLGPGLTAAIIARLELDVAAATMIGLVLFGAGAAGR